MKTTGANPTSWRNGHRAPAILFCDHNPSRSNGGEELVLHETLLGLAARGRRCLLAYHQWGDLVPEYEAADIECRQFDLTAVRLSQPWRFAMSIAQQSIWARRAGVGVVHCNSYMRAPHAAAVKYIGGLRSICQFHLPVPTYLSRQYRWGLQQLDRFIAVSACTAEEWSETLGMSRDRIAVLYNPIDTKRFRPNLDARSSIRLELDVEDDSIVVGYCGRLVEEKGIDVLFRAVARLVSERHKVRLLIIGSDAQNVTLHGEPLEPKLRTLGQELGIANTVHFLGVRHDVERLYNAMDVLVLPSIFSEAFGLTVAEALSCAVPSIASRVGGIPEILSGPLKEQLVPPNDDEALATALRHLIDDRRRGALIGEMGRKIVEEKFSLSLYLDRFEQLLEGTLE